MRMKSARLARNIQHSRGYVDQVPRFTTACEMTIVRLCIGIGVALPFVPPAIESWKNRLKMENSATIRTFDIQSANEEDTVA